MFEGSRANPLASTWSGARAFVTGHTGFKGAWLASWLSRLDAEVTAYALSPQPGPSMYALADIPGLLAADHIGDVRDRAALTQAMQVASPQVVFHLAAQSLVRPSYADPLETWGSNVLGTATVLEAVRACPSVKAVVVVTSDKCYANQEWEWGYRENDRLGGHDPYSASKAACEILVDSYRKSFFDDGRVLLASARAGNVIGGGDFSVDRLIPDAMRGLAAGQPMHLRNPNSTRPWQHVLQSLHGYLLLAGRLLDGDADCADAFNFGPAQQDNLQVGEVLARMKAHLPALAWTHEPVAGAPHEAGQLYVDSSRAQRVLGWQAHWTLDQALAATARWYQGWLDGADLRALTAAQIDDYSRHC